jgi:tetratricopeptide (TPR) repeat protein
MVAKKKSDYEAAEAAYKAALQLLAEQGADSALYRDVVSNLADVHRKKGQYAQARELYLSALRKVCSPTLPVANLSASDSNLLQAEQTYGLNHPHVAELCNNLGMLEKKEGKYEEALQHYRTALRIATHFFGKQHPSVGMYLTNLGDIYR